MVEGECEFCHRPMDTAEYKEPCAAASLHELGKVGCVLCNHTDMMTIKEAICEECFLKFFEEAEC